MIRRNLLAAVLPLALFGVVQVAGSAAFAAGKSAADPLDWPHWRGPEMNGISRERNLPDRWSPDGENLLWRKEEFATRSTPIVMRGKLYTVCRAFPETTKEGEKVVCLNPETGELIWETVNNVFLSDAPAERVGWSSVAGDPETGNVYVLGLGCFFQCLDGETGKPLWQHSMSEEYGMLSTYGGRTNFPVVFENLVIISGVMTGWGELAIPAHRFVAFDKETGKAVWITSTRVRPEDTTYSTPVFTVFNGQAAMVFGGGDGSVYAIQPRTGKVIWDYHASNRGINTTPLVVDNIVYAGHAEKNAADTTVLGAVFAFDGRRTGKITEDDLLWKIPARTVGRSAPLFVDGRVYMIEDGATLMIMDAKTGKDIGKEKLGRIMFGSAVYGDGKIYVGEATGRWYILEPSDKGVKILHRERLNNEEILGSPIISHGRIYLPTIGALYAIGKKDHKPQADSAPPAPPESPASTDQKIASLQVTPVESILKPGETLQFTVNAYNAHGQFLKAVDVPLTVKGPGTIAKGVFSTPANTGLDAAFVTATVGEITSTARVRLIPPLPWNFDFEDGKVPAPWIGAAYRHQPRKLEGNGVLVKVSTIPKGTRSQGWMGPTNLHDCTIQADFLATQPGAKLPDMGLINQRYTLDLMSTQRLQIRSWTSRLELRFAKTVDFPWQADTWYTMKFQSENKDGKAVLRGKVWKRGTSEPKEWAIEAADETPNVAGSPGLFGNASDAEFYIDNVKVTANGASAKSAGTR
jgi:outer membrane protein assembly factor BamB